MSYGKVNYSRGAFKLNAFANIVDAEAPNLLLADPATGGPIQLNFKTQTFDVELGHAMALGGRHAVSYGGNYRRNNFDITLAPASKDRNEIGAYAQDDISAGKFRFSLGARVDKFGNIEDPVFSPRLAAMFQPSREHSFRMSFNRAFRSPSTMNNYLDQQLVSPVDLRGLAPLLPPPLQPLVASPFPLVVKAVGSELPIGSTPQPKLKQESLTAYEWAYTGTIRGRTTIGAAFYINDFDDQVNFVQLPSSLDPYTRDKPSARMAAAAGRVDADGAARYLLAANGLHVHESRAGAAEGNRAFPRSRVCPATLTAFVNYSWQGKPTHSRRSESVSDGRAVLAAREPLQHRRRRTTGRVSSGRSS